MEMDEELAPKPISRSSQNPALKASTPTQDIKPPSLDLLFYLPLA
jgi:hypothetical protein